ncbi:hypothetical protein FDUTEX481_05606 [Tolypothrix sp. PCC 7601]|nr:hypothetical protein FDUTEX481_05606 [Tolypothrix sp. PCC 7601]
MRKDYVDFQKSIRNSIVIVSIAPGIDKRMSKSWRNYVYFDYFALIWQ